MKNKDRQYLWAIFAGRCAFPDCKTPLFHELPDGTISNIGELCHIIAEQPEGPRGDPEHSQNEKTNPDNLILLCRPHHKIVDDAPSLYTVDYLRKMRADHIDWVNARLDTMLKEELWTGLILFNKDFGTIDADTIQQEVFPEITLRDCFIFPSEGRPKTEDQWSSLKQKVERWWSEIAQKNKISHSYAIFANDYIPIITFLGFLIRDTTPTKLFHYQRVEHSWKWPEDVVNPPQLFTNFSPLSTDSYEPEIAISISISAKIAQEEIYATVPSTVPIIELYLEEPSRIWLRSETQLIEFKALFLEVLDTILQKTRALTWIHLFCACPSPIAFIIGSLINPSMFPTIQTYNYHWKDHPHYQRAIRFNE